MLKGKTTLTREELDEHLASGYMKYIPNANNYAVTRDGKVISTVSLVFKKLTLNSKGICRIRYADNDNKASAITLHKLVADLFIDGYDMKEFGKVIKFKDGNKLNCTASNLEDIARVYLSLTLS